MADLGKLIPKVIKKAFPLFGSIRQAVTFQSMAAPTYDVSNGNVADVITSIHSLNVIWDSFSFTQHNAQSQKQDESTILSGDRKVIYPALDLPVVAKVGDRVVDSAAVAWVVMGVDLDPATAHYSLHVRPWVKT